MEIITQAEQLTQEQKTIRRLKRKLEERDKKIEGYKAHINKLQMKIALLSIERDKLPREITKAVQEAICNVRMIPVHGSFMGTSDRIIEVRKAGE